MAMLKFILPITPTSQARPRVSRFGAYKSKTQQANERTLEACLLEHKPDKPLSGPLVMNIIAGLPVPKSTSKKRRENMLTGVELPDKRPDIDNIIKQLLDSMTRLQFWEDDKQIVVLRCEKMYLRNGLWGIYVCEAAERGVA